MKCSITNEYENKIFPIFIPFWTTLISRIKIKVEHIPKTIKEKFWCLAFLKRKVYLHNKEDDIVNI